MLADLVTGTVVDKQSNSVLLVGARSTGKTLVVESYLRLFEKY